MKEEGSLRRLFFCVLEWYGGGLKSRKKIGSEQRPSTAAGRTREIGVPLPYPTYMKPI